MNGTVGDTKQYRLNDEALQRNAGISQDDRDFRSWRKVAAAAVFCFTRDIH
jgi:hypothetical protein